MGESATHTTLAPGTDVGPYRIVKCIGTGGSGVVYEARHRRLDKPVALKTLHDALRRNHEVVGRFVNEGIAASKITHPHVVAITDVGESESVPFLVMELLEGEPLSALIQRQGALPTSTVATIMVPVAAALSEAHRLGVVHRDLKPDNIFLTRSHQGGLHPKVLDFGISKVLDGPAQSNLTTEGSFIGTPSYASPEQIDNSLDIDRSTDQYSFGVVLYELATGRSPFRGFASLYPLLKAISSGEYEPPSIHRADLDPRLEAIVLRAMSTDRDKRFSSMKDLGHQLLEFADESTRTVWQPFFEPFDEALTRPSVAPPANSSNDPRSATSSVDPVRTERSVQSNTVVAIPSPQRERSERSRDPVHGSAIETPGRPVARSLTAGPKQSGETPSVAPSRGWIAIAALALLGTVALLTSQRQPPPAHSDSQGPVAPEQGSQEAKQGGTTLAPSAQSAATAAASEIEQANNVPSAIVASPGPTSDAPLVKAAPEAAAVPAPSSPDESAPARALGPLLSSGAPTRPSTLQQPEPDEKDAPARTDNLDPWQ